MKVAVYSKGKSITLWKKLGDAWFKFLVKTPKGYADVEAKVLKKKPDYSPCWWGMGEQSPDEQGYKFIGELYEKE